MLLSTIYSHLSDHYERSSPRIVIAVLAFMLTATSRSYFQSLCASVGYNTSGVPTRALPSRSSLRLDESERALGGGAPLDDVVFEEQEADVAGEEVPEFVSSDVAEVLSRARRSLVLLRAADPDHPLLTSTHLHREIEWVWTEEQLDAVANEHAPSGAHPSSRRQHHSDATLPSTMDVLAAFKVFDLTPGVPPPTTDEAQLAPGSSFGLLSGAYTTSSLTTFLAAFPATLLPSTPTLAHLTARILYPLTTHASALSGALVSRVLSPTTHLHLHTHLVLLRGYLLLTAHAFKVRLQDALFSDAEEVHAPIVGSRTYAAREARESARERQRTRTESGRSNSRRRAESGRAENEKTRGAGRRAIGLSPALTVGDRWPPGGTDLNFHLRTVIVDSLEEGRIDDEQQRDEDWVRAQRKILEEAEWRLGFAIRDLPVGTGREKWLNPLCESLFSQPVPHTS